MFSNFHFLFMLMKMLISTEELIKKLSRDLIPYECKECHNTFYIKKHYALMPHRQHSYNFCSPFSFLSKFI